MSGLTEFVADNEAMVEHMIERIGGVSWRHNHDGVTSLNAEIEGEVMAHTVAEDVAESINSESHAVIGHVMVGLPKVDLTDGGATLNLIGEESLVTGPGLGVGIVGIVSIGTTDGTVGGGNEERTTDKGQILHEAGSSNFTTITFPNDIGHVVHVAAGGIVPSGIVDTAVVSNASLDEGVGIAIGTGDDGTVGSDSKTINLNVVQTTAVVAVSTIVKVGINATVSGKIIFGDISHILFIPENKLSNLMNAGMYKHTVGIDV